MLVAAESTVASTVVSEFKVPLVAEVVRYLAAAGVVHVDEDQMLILEEAHLLRVLEAFLRTLLAHLFKALGAHLLRALGAHLLKVPKDKECQGFRDPRPHQMTF
eukprot:Gregarina_sp_Poly_1__156@NODE_1035_length_5289_cov_139_924933_g719_i0_p5_GENE_NODE_1035_length_5289_cov_139_924933_g719_i0NODE_1035_length_5289_cov_139_924933_g719_i0_p5_ORF_typecomplete_len104_score14_18Dcc1/PF09724_9/0_18Glyoxalase_6/PF18029_1/7_8Glyoxalase_6/PF18029_1/1_4e02_NODE_1035_length_5289_cov_139_924933_g719_i033123623